jgi:prepilin-type N-terminal cleavage/methylation domain-containing protein
MQKIKKAFSLIELSIVILIIGILIAGVTQGSRLLEMSRISSARTLTKSAPVHSIKNLVSWYESTLEESFDADIDPDSDATNKIANWYDIVSTSNVKNNASQGSAGNQPTYVKNSINGLPTVRFINADAQYLNLPDGTVPYNNSSYTIFFVSKADGFGNYGLLGSGDYNEWHCNAFRYDGVPNIRNYWWGHDIPSSDVLTSNQPYIFSFYYNNTWGRKIYINGAQRASSSDGNNLSNQATASNNTIGKTVSSEYMNGDIAEIIIFDRALKDEERNSIEIYLSKKWGIKLSTS